MSKQIPELTIIPTPTAGQESLIETVVARHDTYATSRMTLAQIFTLGSISGSIKVALDALSALIATNTTNITNLGTNKLDKVGALRTGLTANRALIVDASGNETYLTGTTSQQIGFDGAGKPIAVTPTVDIHGQTLKTAPVGADELLISDSEASFANKRITINTLTTPVGNGSDGALNISSGTTTLAFDSNGYIEKNYTSFTMTGGTLNFSGPTVNGGVVVINVSGDFSMTGSSTIDISGMGGAGGGQSYVNGDGVSGAQGKSFLTYVNASNFGIRGVSGGVGSIGVGIGSGGYLPGFCGAGGASGRYQGNSGDGGRGGGLLIIEIGGKFTFNTPSVINANGANGLVTPGNGGGGGGGGAGSVIIRAKFIVSNTGSITVNGGNGGNGNIGPGGCGGGSYSSGGLNFASGISNTWGSGGTPGNTSAGGGGGGAGYYKIN